MSRKILVVEDDAILAETYKTKLAEDAGFDVAVALSAAEAEKIVEAFKPDLVILDILMPDVNGFELLELLKKKGDLKDSQITVATNLDQMSTINRALELGATSYFIKSEMSTEDIVAHCKKVFEQNEQSEESLPKQ